MSEARTEKLMTVFSKVVALLPSDRILIFQGRSYNGKQDEVVFQPLLANVKSEAKRLYAQPLMLRQMEFSP